MASTSQEFICSDRDEETGRCAGTSAVNKRVNLAYFSVTLPPTQIAQPRSLLSSSSGLGSVNKWVINHGNRVPDRAGGNLLLAVRPHCNISSSSLSDQGYVSEFLVYFKYYHLYSFI